MEGFNIGREKKEIEKRKSGREGAEKNVFEMFGGIEDRVIEKIRENPYFENFSERL